MQGHRKIVGALHLIMGLFALVPVMILTAVFGGIMGIVAAATHGHQATTVVGISLAAVLMIVVISVGLLGMLGIIAGFGVLAGQRWADFVATAIGALHLFNVPFGTA